MLDREAIDFAHLGDRDPRQIVGRDGGQGIASRRRELRKLLNPPGPASRPRQA